MTDDDVEATGRCCCAGCIGIGPCDLDLGRGDAVSTCVWCWDHDCCCDDVEDQYDLPGDQDWPTVTPDHHLHQETTP